MSQIELRVLPLSQLAPAPYNPRRPLSQESPAYQKLKCRILVFGLVEPIVWNELTGHVVGGHLRLAILQELGVKEVPVCVVRLTDAREKALNIVLNNLEAQGRFDPDRLFAILRELEAQPEFSLTGFETRVLSTLQMRPAESRSDEMEPDRVVITIVTDPETYEQFAPELDALVSRYDLVAHIRRGE
ncbi:MAG TPA: ParB N-terminal domain-containing protein [Gemmata sp.]|nr:ParB N-terminal domain-containing protein [Gemmata sp.]